MNKSQLPTAVIGGTAAAVPPGSAAKPFLQPLFGALKGTFTIAPGVDLTEPACPEWAEFIASPEWELQWEFKG